MHNMQDFEAQGIVNTIHIMTKKRYKATGHLLNGEDTVAPVDGVAGESVGGDSRGVQLAGGCKHVVGVCENEKEPGAQLLGQLEERVVHIARTFRWREVTSIILSFALIKSKPTAVLMESLEKQDLVIRDSLKTHHLILLF